MMMKQTRSLPVRRLREFFAYDPRSGELRYRPNRARHWFKSDRLWKSWNAQFGGKVATTHVGLYCAVTVNQRRYLAHRVIWAIMTGAWPKEEIDHLNGDRADNRWRNLRAATRVQNGRNMTKPINNTSGVAGVHWFKRAQLWQVYALAGSKRITKYARTFDEAVALRNGMKQRLGMTERHGA